MHVVSIERSFEGWREAARMLVLAQTPPAEVLWQERGAEQGVLFEKCSEPSRSGGFSVSPEFLKIARDVACHRDQSRWPLLYRILWRLVRGERHLLELASDPDVLRLVQMQRQVRTDRHKMTAFVRFREVVHQGKSHFVAWHRPAHYVLRSCAEFFVKRFGGMNWSILTPDDCAHWDQRELRFSPGVERSRAPSSDELEGLWGTYYANISNPARIKLAAMKREMPVRYWECLPEAQLIPQMLREAGGRVEEMMARKLDEYPTAEAFMPARITLRTLQESSAGCKGCPLYKLGTQTVFGEGRSDARVMMIGEQPGDQEDQAGKPFVGPAGQLLDRALEEAEIDRREVYVTNAVKHFKWEPRGNRRIHSKPSSREVAACKPWLTAEIGVIKPQLIVCLGATAAQALLGKDFRITRSRGKVLRNTQLAPAVVATVHPSSILRTPSEDRDAAYAAFLDDLRAVEREIHQMKR